MIQHDQMDIVAVKVRFCVLDRCVDGGAVLRCPVFKGSQNRKCALS